MSCRLCRFKSPGTEKGLGALPGCGTNLAPVIPKSKSVRTLALRKERHREFLLVKVFVSRRDIYRAVRDTEMFPSSSQRSFPVDSSEIKDSFLQQFFERW